MIENIKLQLIYTIKHILFFILESSRAEMCRKQPLKNKPFGKLWGKYMLISLKFIWEGTILHALQERKSCEAYNFIIKVGNVQMAYF
jgi:hypothetical protein